MDCLFLCCLDSFNQDFEQEKQNSTKIDGTKRTAHEAT